MCVDVTAVDYLAHPDRALPDGVVAERFEVVVNMLDITAGRRIRLRVQVPDDDATLPTLFDLHPGTEAMEREVYDMFGITFTDHPDMTRILMPEDWEGHPLRKDYAVGCDPGAVQGGAVMSDLIAQTSETDPGDAAAQRGAGQGTAARGRRGAADERGRGGPAR